jgi:hypothetical protein
MGIKVDGGVSFQPDTAVTETGKADLPVAPSQPAPPTNNAVVPFTADAGVAYPSPSQSSDAGPTVKAGELQAQVELCKRAADLPIVGQLGAKHHWLRTGHKEVGMGQNTGTLPGHGEAPPLGLPTQWIDHSKEKDKQCVVVPDVDAACVEGETEFGKDTGQWIPFVNDCHTKTQEVLDTCSTKPKNSGPDFGGPSKTGAGYSL